jgi:hypothetical protein
MSQHLTARRDLDAVQFEAADTALLGRVEAACAWRSWQRAG